MKTQQNISKGVQFDMSVWEKKTETERRRHMEDLKDLDTATLTHNFSWPYHAVLSSGAYIFASSAPGPDPQRAVAPPGTRRPVSVTDRITSDCKIEIPLFCE